MLHAAALSTRRSGSNVRLFSRTWDTYGDRGADAVVDTALGFVEQSGEQ
jgi:hypothetical protein